MIRRLATAALALGLVWGCGDSDDSDDGAGTGTFTLKFINRGDYPVNALWLQHAADTSTWGTSILPVDSLTRLQFVRIGGIPGGPEYAFKVQFDSAGTAAFLTYPSMPSGPPDTITAHAALGDLGWDIGQYWGLQLYDGEQDVTP